MDNSPFKSNSIHLTGSSYYPLSIIHPMSSTLTAAGETTEGQLCGGPQDGRDVLVPLTNGLPPPVLIRPSGRYVADGILTNGLLRYRLEGGEG
jgi:hypothetical protein